MKRIELKGVSVALCMVALTVIAYSLALVFVFPGAFEPIAVPHNDLYMPLAIANSEFNPNMPRPTGSLLDFFRGQLGLEGSIYFSLAFVFLNCALTFFLLFRVFPVESRKIGGVAAAVGYALYVWSVFTHPYFYIFAAWDAYAQFSYFFLLMAVFWYLQFSSRQFIAFAGFFLLVVIGFLSKETYIASFLFLLLLIEYRRRGSASPHVLLLPIVAVAAFAVAFGVNASLNSPFTTNTDFANNAYKISLSPASVIREWAQYGKDGWTGWTAGAFVLTLLGALTRKSMRRVFLVSGALVLAGVLAWLPNAALPNHHFEQYSFTGAYLFYLAVPVVIGSWAAAVPASRILASLAVLVFIGLPFVNRSLYQNGVVQFYETQIERQRHLLAVIDRIGELERRAGATQRVLLVGVAPPFNPFDYPAAFKHRLGSGPLSLDVAAYGAAPIPILNAEGAAGTIRRLPVSQIELAGYDRIIRVDLSGREIQVPTLASPLVSSLPSDLSATDLVIYPALAGIFQSGRPVDAAALLECGVALQTYGADEKSLSCLRASMALAPENPYPHYYSALANEQLGRIELAASHMRKAIAAKDQEAVNPAFLQKLKQLEGRLSS